jgi:hypothetical protein
MESAMSAISLKVPTWKQAGEWFFDLAGTWLAFYILKEWLIDADKNLADQPLVTAAVVGGAWVAFKLLRQFKAFDK